MKIVMFYGGRGLIEDPTLYVLKQMERVLTELEVEIKRINLFEHKDSINELPQTLASADAVIFAVTVEWNGIGGYMQTFLDACWFYTDKTLLENKYMYPVVLSTTYGEREAEQHLISSWEIIGGTACHGLVGYVDNTTEFETSADTLEIIEKRTEDFYRMLQRKPKRLQTSLSVVKNKVRVSKGIDFTPQETRQLSLFVDNEKYVKQQKEDIEELSSLFKELLKTESSVDPLEYVQNKLKAAYKGQLGLEAVYKIIISDKSKNLIIQVAKDGFKCYYGDTELAKVLITLTLDNLTKISEGRMTFQKAFMVGEISVKGDFKTLYTLDQIFKFK